MSEFGTPLNLAQIEHRILIDNWISLKILMHFYVIPNKVRTMVYKVTIYIN